MNKQREMAPNSFLNLAVSSFCLQLLALVLPYQAFGSSRSQINEFNAPPPGLCASAVIIHGYKCQEFDVKTDDGYILSLQRIPEGRTGGGGGGLNKPPVLLQHGVLVDGMTWLLNSPEQSLAMILADNGFDVWISNTRGTKFSRRHVNLDPSNPKYWNWSWDDLVLYDLPSVTEFVFRRTGQKMHYVGHSMGTLMALASFAEGKQVDKIRSAALLSPVAYLSHMTTALGVVAARSFVGEISTVFGLAEFYPKGKEVSKFLKSLCAFPGLDCYDMLTALTGIDLSMQNLQSLLFYIFIGLKFSLQERIVV
ncbi:triacylglycerol lipase 2-like [Olea europaea subsp. europaea]|uniref:Triacylglycerol lipase 2-like n=1 Tax=Olea europaea subsp. europaea TaxID=158383 RepID=A0A8S0PMT9_OLEEU|nr:triacylglycerol lipase 2-like [Olea europaea subsp. europaea]